jgi:hypothetical protein
MESTAVSKGDFPTPKELNIKQLSAIIHIQFFQNCEVAFFAFRRFHLRLFVFNSFRIVSMLFSVYYSKKYAS